MDDREIFIFFKAHISFSFFLYLQGIPLSFYWLALTGAILTAVFMVTSVWIPETPRFLLIRRLRNEAVNVLKRLRGPFVDVNVECREIEDALDNSDVNLLLLSHVIALVPSFTYLSHRPIVFYIHVTFLTGAAPRGWGGGAIDLCCFQRRVMSMMMIPLPHY